MAPGRWGPTLLTLVLAAPAARPDTLFLKDGRVYEDVKLSLESDILVVQFEHGSIEIREDEVEEYFLSDGGSLGALSADDEAKLAEGLVPFRGKWVSPEKRDREVAELIEAQLAQANVRRDARKWRNRKIVESKLFHYEYTVPDEVFERYSERMEAYYDTFDKLWKIRREGIGKLAVYMYADRELFYQVTAMGRGTIAFFRFVKPPYELHFYYDALDPLAEPVVFHEYGHYLQKLINQDFNYNHWPGEALAEYFSTGSWDEKRKRFEVEGQVLEGRLVEIQRDMEDGDYVTIESLVRQGDEGQYHDYTWGWSLVYFLMSDPKLAKNFEKFYLGLARARDVDRIHGSAFKNTKYSLVEGDNQYEYFKKCLRMDDDEVKELQQRWYAYLRELDVTSAAGFARAARSASNQNLNHRARRLYEESIATGNATPLTYHRYAEVLDELGEHKDAWEAWATAIEMDPFVADFHIGLGRSLLRSGKQADGKERLLLAQEIEPDNLYLEQHLEELLDGK